MRLRLALDGLVALYRAWDLAAFCVLKVVANLGRFAGW